MATKKPDGLALPSAAVLSQATALAGVLSGKAFSGLKLEMGAKVEYNADKDVLTLPGVPMGDIPDDVKAKLRAYLGHEAAGKRGHSGVRPSDTRWKGKPGLYSLVEGVNDARLDNLVAKQWPGLAMDIRDQLQAQHKAMRANPAAVQATHGDLATVLRHVGEGVCTLDEAVRRFPNLAPLLEQVRPEVEALQRSGWESEKQCIDSALRMGQLLTEPPQPEQGGGQGEGQGRDGEGQQGDAQRQGQQGQGDGKGQGQGQQGQQGKDKGQGQGSQKAQGRQAPQQQNGQGQGSQQPQPQGQPSQQPQQQQGHGSSRGGSTIPDGQYKRLEDQLAQQIASQMQLTPEGDCAFSMDPSIQTMEKWPARPGPQNLTREQYRDVASAMFRTMQQILHTQAPAWVHRRNTGEVDESRLIDLVVMRQEDSFKRLQLDVNESIAVLVSIDGSSSMDGRKAHMAGLLGAALNEALGRAQIPSAIVVWEDNGKGSNLPEVYRTTGCVNLVAKDWRDRWNGPGTLNRVQSLNRIGRGGTPMADGMHYAFRALLRRPEQRKLCILITDGEPGSADRGGHGPHEKEVARLNLLAPRLGIDLLAFGLGVRRGHPLERLFTGHWVSVEDTTELVPTVKRELLKRLQQLHRESLAKAEG